MTESKSNSHMLARMAEVSDCYHFEILSPKQMLQSLSIALRQVQAGNTFENILNEICQIIYSSSKKNYLNRI